MTLRSFIERPVLASVISILIVIAGIVGLASLPIEQYPDIAPPTVMVRASYPGASAETIQKSVIVPLEEAINGVEDMDYILSNASVGSGSLSIYFRQGTDADMAAVNVQNKVSRATGLLPSEVTQIGVMTMKRQTSMVKIFALYSPDDSYDETFLSNYAKIMGLENNIYLQTGLIMLIGLLAKTAILLTEYAGDRRRAGMSLTQAAVSAAKVRLRPILMTVLTMVFGMIPLVLAHGVGANGNSTLGSGVVGGMIVGTLALLFLVPALFIVFQTIQEKIKPLQLDPDPQWAVRAEVEECKNEKEE